jgi:hypothetical protein
VGQLDLVNLGAFSTGGGRLVGEGDVELLRSGVALEPVDGKMFLPLSYTQRGVKCRVYESKRMGTFRDRSYICGATSNCRRRMRSVDIRAGRVFSEGEITTSGE